MDDLVRDVLAARPDVPIEVREEVVTPARLAKVEARLARGERGAVGAIVKDGRGLVLLQRHDPRTGWPPDAWAVPGGGVREGEPPQDAVAREVFEETGLRVEVGAPLLVIRQSYRAGDRTAEYPFAFFLARPVGPTDVAPRAGEVLEVRWFDRLPESTFDRDALTRFM